MWTLLLTNALAGPVGMQVHCALDDKYATPASEVRMAWAHTVFSGKASPRDLLARGGSGPAGAEWNTSCDLLVRVHAEGEAPRLKVKAGVSWVLAPVPEQPHAWFVWVSQADWQGARQAVTAENSLGTGIPKELYDAVQVTSFELSHEGRQSRYLLLWAGGE